MRVRLNLATKPMETHRRFLAGAGVSACAAALVFLALGWHVYSVYTAAKEVRARDDKMRQELARCYAQRQELDAYFKQKDIASLHDRAGFINGIIDARSFNWTQMFMDLEHTLPGGVRVIRIEPKQVGGHVEVKLTVGAVNDDAKLNFLHVLATSKHFSDVQEQSDVAPSTVNNVTADQRIVQLTATYLGT
jgi:Tfp pilus assembly protein PilN